ncbi:MAG: HDOD domain-containing protein [Planctomycetaceae bacterium]|nr:HDOD domain-containing protein [Planctomycetaceae bacterium]
MSHVQTQTQIVLPPEIRSRIAEGCRGLQMLPAVARDALEIARDPNCSIIEFTTLVERDVKLAADILAMSNSVVYSAGRSISNLHQAVVRLGFRQCKNLILSTSAASLMSNVSIEQEWIREVLWKHGFLTAILAIHVNRTLSIGYRGEEFTAGLMHDWGRTLTASCLPELFHQADALTFDEGEATLRQEMEALGATHCEIGGWFAQSTSLPPEITEVVRFHHTPEQAGEHQRLVALIAICDEMANCIQREQSRDFVPAHSPGAVILEGCGIPRATERLREMAPTIMEAAVRDAADMNPGA